MELTDNDKQRIEQEARNNYSQPRDYPMEQAAFKRGAEYATIYERQQQAELLTKYSEFLEDHNYLDSDWRDEKPGAIDMFLNSLKPNNMEAAEYNFKQFKQLSKENETLTKENERLKETLSEIRHALYDRDTDDAILDCIAKHLDEAGFPYEPED